MSTFSAPVLALMSPEMRLIFEQRLAPVHIDITFVRKVVELLALIRDGWTFSVILLPASLPDDEQWAVWGDLALLMPRPEVVIYTRTANFDLWSGVLELGGHDVLAEPFSAEDVQRTVLGAKQAFEQRQAQEVNH